MPLFTEEDATPLRIVRAEEPEDITEEPEEEQDPSIDRLAIGVLGMGSHDPNKLAAWSGMSRERVVALLKDSEFLSTLKEMKKDSKKVIPCKAEIFALLRIEAEEAGTSRDRQSAMKTLLDHAPSDEPQKTGEMAKHKFSKTPVQRNYG